MSVAADMRRRGIAKKILERLCREAISAEFRHLILETTATWHAAIAFYKKFGFCVTHRQEGAFGGEVHFFLDLTSWEEP